MKAVNLGKKFGKRWIFRGLDFEIEKGQCWVILGSNGSGKSTLLKLMSGLMAPSEGKMLVPEELTVGYAALDSSLYGLLTPVEHIALFSKLRNTPSQPQQILDDIGLGAYSESMVGTFSTGMRTRMKLALATFFEPDILILDEPSAAMDETGQKLISQIVQDQLAHGSVIIATNQKEDRDFATHTISLA